MKALLLLTVTGPLVILTTHDPMDPVLLEKLEAKGMDKFLAFEIPIQLAIDRYGGHFRVVVRDLSETDDLRVLDYNSRRAFQLFHFDELGPPIVYERERGTTRPEPEAYERPVV